MATIPVSTPIDWPDLAAYGLHFGVIDIPNLGRRLVMVDETNSWGALARKLGFQHSRWLGIWLKESLDLALPMDVFPRGRILSRTPADIQEDISRRLVAQKKVRISEAVRARSPNRNAWRPDGGSDASVGSKPAMAAAAEAPQIEALPLGTALRQTIFLGLNHLGQSVYELGDGTRQTMQNDAVVAREGEQPAPHFLRAQNDEDLVSVASGMLKEIDAGSRLGSADFERYVAAALSTDFASEDASSIDSDVMRFHRALDAALLKRLQAEDLGTDRDRFAEALKLHDGRPPYRRTTGTLPTPLPLSVVMQTVAGRLASKLPDGVAIYHDSDAGGEHSWMLKDASRGLNADGDVPLHSVCVAGAFSAPTEPTVINGLKVSRADHAALLRAVEARMDEGVTVFVVAAGDKPGHMTPDFRRVIGHIGARYKILSVADLAPAMMGAGNTVASRLVVVGDKLRELDYAYAPPSTAPVYFDYEALWNWAEVLASEASADKTFLNESRDANRWQSPYIPASQVSEPFAMSPRNLLGPTRKALGRIVEASGLGIDEFVSDRLQIPMDELGNYLVSEQIDATALSIFAIERGHGFVEADMTGLGKGRVLAAVSRYAALQNKKSLFVTEKTSLFRDFFGRDVPSIGSSEVIGAPLILNDKVEIRDMRTGTLISKAMPRDDLQRVLDQGIFPEGQNAAAATYSQFNRLHDPRAASRVAGIRLVVEKFRSGAIDRESMIYELSTYVPLGLSHGDRMRREPLADIAARFTTALNGRQRQSGANKEMRKFLEFYNATPADLDRKLKRLCSHDMSQYKIGWLQQRSDCVLLLDESHNAAGSSSNTHHNISTLLSSGTQGVVYSSATFAKGTDNFSIYAPIFPSSVNTATIDAVLKRGGSPLQEIFSSMLCDDGRLIRREHDLSTVEFRVSVDNERLPRNRTWSDALADVFSAMGALSTEVQGRARAETAQLRKDIELAIIARQRQILQQNAAATPRSRRRPLTSAQQKAALAKAIRSDVEYARLAQTGLEYSHFSSSFYNLTRAFMLSLAADHTADLAIDALQKGRKPVIAVENTMDSALAYMASESESELADAQQPVTATDDDESGGEQDGGDSKPDDSQSSIAAADANVDLLGSAARGPAEWPMGRRVSFKDVLRRCLDRMFNAFKSEFVNGVLVKKRVSLNDPSYASAVEKINQLIDALPEIPLSPLDAVADRLRAEGFSCEEVSGRRFQVTNAADGTHTIKRLPARDTTRLVDAFNAGTLDSLVLSGSGATGISLHAAREFPDQRQRHLIEMQPSADINRRLQMWGRVNRLDQTSHPLITFVLSGLPGEMRLMMMTNNKLRRLSANISANADNSALDEDVPDILNSLGNVVCYNFLEANPDLAKRLAIDPDTINVDALAESQSKFVDMVTGRIQMLYVAEQERCYNALISEFKAMVQELELAGRNPLKSEERDYKARIGERRVVDTSNDASDSSFNGPVYATEVIYRRVREGVPREEVLKHIAMGQKWLRDSFGLDWAVTLNNKLDRQLAAKLIGLCKEGVTVKDALESRENNAVKTANARAGHVRVAVNEFRPGKVLRLRERADDELLSREIAGNSLSSGEQANDSGKHIVLALYHGAAPSDDGQISMEDDSADLTVPSQWSVRLLSFDDGKIKTLALSSLLTMNRETIYHPGWMAAGETMDVALARFLDEIEAPTSTETTQVVLDGNLFRAAEISSKMMTGRAISYSDERGRWHQAIALPASYTLDNALELPVEMRDESMLLAAVREIVLATPEDLGKLISADKGTKRGRSNFYGSGTISTLRAESHGQESLPKISIRAVRGGSLIQVQLAARAREKMQQLGFLSALAEISSEKALDGVDRSIYLINPADIGAACNAVSKASNALGDSLFVHPVFREWGLKHLERRRTEAGSMDLNAISEADMAAERDRAALAAIGI